MVDGFFLVLNYGYISTNKPSVSLCEVTSSNTIVVHHTIQYTSIGAENGIRQGSIFRYDDGQAVLLYYRDLTIPSLSSIGISINYGTNTIAFDTREDHSLTGNGGDWFVEMSAGVYLVGIHDSTSFDFAVFTFDGVSMTMGTVFTEGDFTFTNAPNYAITSIATMLTDQDIVCPFTENGALKILTTDGTAVGTDIVTATGATPNSQNNCRLITDGSGDKATLLYDTSSNYQIININY